MNLTVNDPGGGVGLGEYKIEYNGDPPVGGFIGDPPTGGGGGGKRTS